MKPERWPSSLVVIHWLTTLLVVIAVGAGFTMVALAADDPLRRVLGRVHALSGLTVGLLTFTRLLIRLLGARPAPIALPPAQRRLATLVHALMYAGLFGLGASGVGTAFGSEWSAFVSGAVERAPALEGLLSRRVHEAVGSFLLVLVALHVAGVVLQQARGGAVVRRMLPTRPAPRSAS